MITTCWLWSLEYRPSAVLVTVVWFFGIYKRNLFLLLNMLSTVQNKKSTASKFSFNIKFISHNSHCLRQIYIQINGFSYYNWSPQSKQASPDAPIPALRPRKSSADLSDTRKHVTEHTPLPTVPEMSDAGTSFPKLIIGNCCPCSISLRRHLRI